MSVFETVRVTEAHGDQCEDHIGVFNDGDRTIIVVADGAGGTGDGAIAAKTVIREVESARSRIQNAEQWKHELQQIDYRITAGQSTAVIVELRPYGIGGASVGDSQAWIVNDELIIDLSVNQHRKPLLGTQQAQPVSFTHPPLDGVLIVATDGFCNYVKRQELPRTVAKTEFAVLARHFVEMVRLPSDELWDDIGIVACRIRPQPRTRKSYRL